MADNAKNRPIVSVVIPVYNCEDYIGRCLDSILSQTFGNFEIVCVDDGSTDGSYNLIKMYAQKDKRIKAVSQSNRGVSATRNHGIEEATGDFITFIDADDFLNPGYLSNFTYDADIDFESQGYSILDARNGHKIKEITHKETKCDSIANIYGETEANRLARSPVSKLFKKTIINDYRISFPVGLSYGEDAIFVKKYLLHCSKSGRSISQSGYNYLVNQNQSSLTSKVHDPRKLYTVTKEDFTLFRRMEQRFGPFPNNMTSFFIRERALEFYWEIYSLFGNSTIDSESRHVFFIKAVKDFFPEIEPVSSLPIRYRLIKLILKKFSTPIAYRIIALISL